MLFRSIYAPPPPRTMTAAPLAPATLAHVQSAPAAVAAPQAVATAPRNPNGPHFYSVHREFGMSPDPIPLSPQFFAGASAGMAEPDPPPTAAAKRVTNASGVTQVVRDTTQPSSSPASNAPNLF